MRPPAYRTVRALLPGTALVAAAAMGGEAVPPASDESDSAIARIVVVGTREQQLALPGSGDVISEQQLERTRVFTANEALRKVPGITARDEEGFGLRPNIGLRGLNPTRTTKITLLEDGVPLAYAPYGDNASYYHPPIDRFASIEVLKGANALAFGPQTIGGVINYISPVPGEALDGFVSFAGGTRDYLNGHARISGGGWLADYVRKEGEGARDNLAHAINDLNVRFVRALNDRHALTVRANAYAEDSTVTYSGLTQAEFERLGARYNPFRNDEFETRRKGASITHEWTPTAGISLTTNLYYSAFDRDWWRQSSTTTDTQCGATFASARLAGSAVDPEACDSAQGRLRSYDSWGIEPRLTVAHRLGELQVSARHHVEGQDRIQINATSPRGRSGTLAESSLRETDAQSAFIANRFDIGAWSVTPIVRYERVKADRTNRLVAGQRGSSTVTEALPGIGVTWNPRDSVTAFASLHRGFAPPRVEDLIGGTGTATDVDSEKSTNLELGVRLRPLDSLSLQAAWYRNDFDNLIAVGSIAGGSTPLSQGEALFSGIELGGQWTFANGLFSNLALSWLDEAEQTSAFRNVANGAIVGVAGNRQPYAPERTLTLAMGYATTAFDLQVEAQHVSDQYSDFANTLAPSADGQRGRIDAHTIFGATVNYRLNGTWSGFVAVKNLADKVYVVDRTRGIQVGQPRLVHAGIRLDF